MPNRNRITKPLVNVISKEDSKRWGYAMSLISQEHEDLVQAHKNVFGSQTYCWNGLGTRHWVWELGGCRVYVSNSKGIAFEVETEQDRQTALQHLEKYLSKWDCLSLVGEDETFEENVLQRIEKQTASN